MILLFNHNYVDSAFCGFCIRAYDAGEPASQRLELWIERFERLEPSQSRLLRLSFHLAYLQDQSNDQSKNDQNRNRQSFASKLKFVERSYPSCTRFVTDF